MPFFITHHYVICLEPVATGFPGTQNTDTGYWPQPGAIFQTSENQKQDFLPACRWEIFLTSGGQILLFTLPLAAHWVKMTVVSLEEMRTLSQETCHGKPS